MSGIHRSKTRFASNSNSFITKEMDMNQMIYRINLFFDFQPNELFVLDTSDGDEAVVGLLAGG